MAVDYKVLRQVKGDPSAEVAPNRRLKINPNQDYLYDMPKELIVHMQQTFPLADLLEGSDGKPVTEEELKERGSRFMQHLISAADSDLYRDRTAEMIEIVAQQTGIRFPHMFERYIELAILSLRPRDTWTIAEATTSTLKVRNFNCSLGQRLAEKGVENCQAFCLAASQVAADKVGLGINCTCNQDKQSGLCEQVYRLC